MQLTPQIKLALVAGVAACMLVLSVAGGYFWGASQAASAPALLSEKAAKAALKRVAEVDPDTAAEWAPDPAQVRVARDDYEQWLEEQLDAAHEELASHAAATSVASAASAIQDAPRDDVLRLVALGAEMVRRADIEKLPEAERAKLSGRVVQAMTVTWKELKGEDLQLPPDLYAAH